MKEKRSEKKEKVLFNDCLKFLGKQSLCMVVPYKTSLLKRPSLNRQMHL